MAAWGEPALEDLTARARIRDAAVRLFTERGAEGTTIRQIAAAAGVSGGLVRHHFGSKDDLRSACDAHALAQLMRFKEQAVLGGGLGGAAFVSSAQPALLRILRYFARSMLDGSPAADVMFSEMVGLAEGWLEAQHPGEISDPAAYAALLVAMELGVLVMRAQLSRALGADVLDAAGHLRLARAKLDLYSKPLVAPELAAQARRAFDQLARGPRPQRRPAGTDRPSRGSTR